MDTWVGTAGEIFWVLGIIAWYVIRYPFERRAKRVRVVESRRSVTDMIGLAAAVLGQGVIPGFYVVTGRPVAADYPAYAWAVALGALLFMFAMWVFRRTHKELGKNWSITLEIRDKHTLVSGGPYALVRHPMYSSFLLIALGQAFLLSNWFVGLAGLAGFSILFLLRVAKEERMMMETFGSSYGDYMKRTKRIIPYFY
ncbi:isoprenylcysteine carboxylmethyltransferase family protein [Neorhizobium sp. T786]|uniref:protein-S-isoprenylcysteine O-methyltransferase n=1 Tax=Pseudorhizobium xiangyangii TaxID=2883104 RepID=UPI001CFF92A4|nr:protein-S-isoprenylcysteine O-methyltransferase [Neorhizobium xiangyangii]MCB5204004.1 isoprenylcysteine carboxylmethyltransferase family protein [Neorhizobium xiangyangii]